MLRLLHMGDLHLGCALGSFSPRVAAARRIRALETLEKVLAQAQERHVDLILLAGDCFDTEAPDPDTVRRLFSLFSQAEVPVVIAPGNHDPYRRGGVWDSVPLPPNVFLFRDAQTAYFDLKELGVRVYGYAFTDATHEAPVLPTADVLDKNFANILLAHADMLSPQSPYAPITGEALAASGFCFAALGHVHKPMAARRFGDTVAAYSGFFAGCGFDECGEGHVNFVQIEGGRVVVTPLETKADRFEICTLDLTGADSGETVRLRVADFLEGAAYPPETAVRLVLCGEVGVACVPDAAALLRLGVSYALFEVKDDTVPLYDKVLLEKDPSLRGAFYRAMKDRLSNEDPAVRAIAAEALRLGLAALSGRELL